MRFLIHGLGASELSFMYLSQNLSDCHTVAYNSHQPLAKSIEQVSDIIKTIAGDTRYHLVGHSLGGVIAMHHARNNEHVRTVTTISSPLGGSNAARLLKWLVLSTPVLADITPTSKFITNINEELHCPVMSVISTAGGYSILGEANDGVVELRSQRHLKFAKHVEVYANHTEVLWARQTLDAIKEFHCD